MHLRRQDAESATLQRLTTTRTPCKFTTHVIGVPTEEEEA